MHPPEMHPPATLPNSPDVIVDSTTYEEARKAVDASTHSHLRLAYGIMPGHQRRRVWILLDKSRKPGCPRFFIARFYISKLRGNGCVKLNLCSRKVEIEAAF